MLSVRLPLPRGLRAVRLAVGVLALAWAGATVAAAAEVRPVVGPGATRDEAVAAYGWPAGQSQSGSREIFTYPQGKIFLENGRVERVDFSPNVAWPAPRAKPSAATATAGKRAETVDENWVTDFAAASTEAGKRHARVLAVFTGSDWSPGSRQFDEEVASDPEFYNRFTIDYVFLRVDFPNRKPLPEALRAQNTLLRERYGVTTYPSMLVLSPGGALLAKVDLENLQGGESYRARIIAALQVVRDALTAKPPPPDPAVVAAAELAAAEKARVARIAAAKAARAGMGTELGASVASATWLVLISLAGGGLLVALVLWWLWRSGPAAVPKDVPMADAPAEKPVTAPAANSAVTDWSKPQLCAMTARLVEAEGLTAALRTADGDVDLAVSRGGEVPAQALVMCVPAEAGRVTTKRVRELLAAVILEGTAEGWLVAPGGFVPEARAFAVEKGLFPIDATALTQRLAALPPLARRRMLRRV